MTEKEKKLLIDWLKQCNCAEWTEAILQDEDLANEFLEYAKKGKILSEYTIWEICTYRD